MIPQPHQPHRPGRGLDWSDDDKATLRRMREARIAVGEIAAALNRTDKAVRGKLTRMGIVIQPRMRPKFRRRRVKT